MLSHTPDFVFDPNFNFATDSLFGVKNQEPATVVPPTDVCYILSETGDFLISEDNLNLIMEICTPGFVLTEPGDFVLTEGSDFVLVE